LDAEMSESVPVAAEEEDGSSDVDDLRPLSPDTSMEVAEDVEPPLSSTVDSDLPADADESALPPSTSSEVPLAEARADTPQLEPLSDVDDTDETMGSRVPSEAGPVRPAAVEVEEDEEKDEDSKSEALASEVLASPVIAEQFAVQEDMDVDIVGEGEGEGESRVETDEPALLTPPESTSPPTPQVPQAEIKPPPMPSPQPPSPPTLAPAPAPVLALPPSAFMLPPRPSSEVFIPATLTPTKEPPHYALEQAAAEPRSLAVSEWLNFEFSLNRHYTLPPARSLPQDQQRRLKLGKSLRKKDKEKDKVPESRKDGTDDWTPLGINKWGVTIKANPLWKRVSRAPKTMSTRDWNVSVLSYRDRCGGSQ